MLKGLIDTEKIEKRKQKRKDAVTRFQNKVKASIAMLVLLMIGILVWHAANNQNEILGREPRIIYNLQQTDNHFKVYFSEDEYVWTTRNVFQYLYIGQEVFLRNNGEVETR